MFYQLCGLCIVYTRKSTDPWGTPDLAGTVLDVQPYNDHVPVEISHSEDVCSPSVGFSRDTAVSTLCICFFGMGAVYWYRQQKAFWHLTLLLFVDLNHISLFPVMGTWPVYDHVEKLYLQMFMYIIYAGTVFEVIPFKPFEWSHSLQISH